MQRRSLFSRNFFVFSHIVRYSFFTSSDIQFFTSSYIYSFVSQCVRMKTLTAFDVFNISNTGNLSDLQPLDPKCRSGPNPTTRILLLLLLLLCVVFCTDRVPINLLDFVQQKSPPYKWYSVYGPAEDDHTVPPVIDGAIWVEEDITYYSTLHSSLLRGSSLSPFVDQVLDQVLLVMVMVFNSVLSYPRLSIVYMSLVTGRDSYNAG